MPSIATSAISIALALLAAGCGGSSTAGDHPGDRASATAKPPTGAPGDPLPQGSEPARLDPANFTTEIDNPYWPMIPGSKWLYRETDTEGSKEKVAVEVTHETREIANGVKARVVRDTVTEGGELVEVTDDWYAQDRAGNIWYLGEDTAEYKDGKVANRQGSFEAGVGGAEAGIALPGNPEPGLAYRQEYYKGEAEDKGEVVAVGEDQVEVPFGFFDGGVLMTRDLVPTEPKAQELKFYARGVGPVLTVHTDGAGGRGELVSYRPGR